MRIKMLSFVLVISLLLSAVPVAYANTADAESDEIDVWVENALKTVYRTSTMPQSPQLNIGMVSAKNEYESAQLAVRSSQAFDITEVQFSDLETPGNDIIAASNLSYHFVEYEDKETAKANPFWPEREGLELYPLSEVPDPLSNEASIEVAANATQPIFITNYVPSDAKPGIYEGIITIKTTIDDYSVPIRVSVYDVSIPEVDKTDFVNYHWNMTNGFTWDGVTWEGSGTQAYDAGKYYYGVETYSDEWFDLMNEFAEAMSKYRTNMVWVRTDLFLNATGTQLSDFVDGIPAGIDWSLFDRYVETYMKNGITHFANQHLIHFLNKMPDEEKPTAAWNTALPESLPVTDAFLKNYLTALYDHLKDKGWLGENGFTWYQHILDEPQSDVHKNWWTYVAKKIKEINAGLGSEFKTMDADPNALLLGDGTIDYLDVMVPYTTKFHELKDQYQAKQAAGKDLWVYTMEVNQPPWLNRFWTQPTLTGRLLYWNISQENVTGHLHWAWNAWYVGPWNGDSYIVYPDKKNMTIKSSLRHEAMRDGLEDYELLHIIKQTNPDLAQQLADIVVNRDDPKKYTLDPNYVKTLHDYSVMAAAGEIMGEIPEPVNPFIGQELPLTHLVDNTDSDVKYSGSWFGKNRQFAYLGTAQSTSGANAYAEYTFIGSGIDVVVEKNQLSGKAAISVDGSDPVTVDLYEKVQHDYYTIFSVNNLPSGEQHTVKVVNLEDKELSIDAFRVKMYEGQQIYNASLASLAITNATNFKFNKSITNYQIMLPEDVNTITLTPTLMDKDGTIAINGKSIGNGKVATAAIPNGKSSINLLSTASDGVTTKLYTLNFLKGNVNEVGANAARAYSEITASAARSGDQGVTYGPAKLADGDYGTMFASMQGYNDTHPFPHEIIMAWDEPQAFNTIVMATASGLIQGINEVDVQVSKDGESWETVAQRVPLIWKSDKDDGVMEHTYANIPAVSDVLKLRVQINDAYYRSWNMYAVYELELYSLPDNGEIDDIKVTKEAQLSGLEIKDWKSGLPIELPFDPNVSDYSIEIGMETDKIAIAPSLKDHYGEIEINGVPIAPGQIAAAAIPEGRQTLTVKAIGGEGAFKEYNIAIKRVNNLAANVSSIALDKVREGSTDVARLIDGNYSTVFTNGKGSNWNDFQFPHTIDLKWATPQTFNTVTMVVPDGAIDHKPSVLAIKVRKAAGDPWIQIMSDNYTWYWEEGGDLVFWPLYEGIHTDNRSGFHNEPLPILAQEDITEMQIVIYDGRFYSSPSYYEINEIEISNIAANGPIVIEAVDTHTITASAGENGVIAPIGAVHVLEGANQVYSITPDNGYAIDKVMVDGLEVTVDNSFTFTNISDSHTIHATFKKIDNNPGGNTAGGDSSGAEPGKHVVLPDELRKPVVDGKVILSVPGDAQQIVLPANTAELLGQNQLVIQTDKLSLALSPKIIKQLTALVSVDDLKDSSIVLTINPLSESSAKGILAKGEAFSHAKLKLSGEVYDFSLSIVTKGGKATSLSQFEHAVTVRMKTDPSINPDLAGIYYIADNGTLKYIGGTYKNGEIYAEVSHFSYYAVLEFEKQFEDVPNAHWASGKIQALTAKQIIKGTSPTTFEPNRSITRAEFTALIIGALKLATPGEIKFADVADNAWYKDAISIAVKAGIVNGKSDSMFDPNGRITREEMVTMLIKAYEVMTSKKLDDYTGSKFDDMNQVSSWAVKYVNASVELGIINGRSENKFAPKGTATRAEAAQVIYNLLNKIG
ncbi:S-layer homology domain-containing protein [Bacillus sp. FJAT-28004]|uniref:S-layer homology domain-containing protein n=1 Tax=Bacillus sp. FJAT-28004 TaxID=1679165 RepID=UPI0006B556EF|nr:S-layer homology domain-containing protein [Bacillus sp. FJAT-28004]